MPGRTKFQKLLEPGSIGAVRLKNRIVRMGALPGMVPSEDGLVQQYYFDFYVARAKGGAALVTVSINSVGIQGKEGCRLDEDRLIPRMKELTDELHKHGCKAFVQLLHVGPWLPPPLTVASSTFTEDEIPITVQSRPNARPLDIDEIKSIEHKFADIAERAQKAGFDGIELNTACTHLLSTFLSRAWNKRTDEYGYASMENRARIVVEIIREIKKRNGKDFAIVVTMSGAEPGVENGITAAESKELAKLFEAAGADCIQVRSEFYLTHKVNDWVPLAPGVTKHGKHDSSHFPDVCLYPEAPSYAAASGVDAAHHGAGGWVPLAANIKKAVRIPVMAVGRLDPEMGEKLIRSGAVDFVNMNRRLIADPDLPNKIMEGRLEDIAPCTACMTCFNIDEERKPLICRINAAVGKEREYEIKPAPKKKKVAVIGSGPAGLEAARVAALRGHEVTVFEKESMLGGALNLAAVVKGIDREDLLSIIDYLKTQVTKAGVDVRLNKEANRATMQELKPDVIIVAVGGSHDIPAIPGINNKNVLTSQALHTQLKNYLKLTGAKLMTKLVTKYVPVGKRVVVMGGNIQGCQTAEFLVRRGRKVTIVEEGPAIGEGLLRFQIKPQLLGWLSDKDVKMMAGVKYVEITDKGLTIINKDGERQTLEADTIVTSLPLKTNAGLYDSLKDAAPEVFAIGDCSQHGLIVDAVAAGSRIARVI